MRSSDHDRAIQAEFDRAATGFAQRTKARFDRLDIAPFARVRPQTVVVEVGGGTGNFLRHLEGQGRFLVNVDLTWGMLDVARRQNPGSAVVQGDGSKLPLGDNSIDLVTCAQMLHHVPQPLPILEEMARVARRGPSVLIVDQCAPEKYEQAVAMNQLEKVRDPSHATSRPPSAFATLVSAAGLEIVDQKIHEERETFSQWMQPGEFDQERIAATLRFIEERGEDTGMDFSKDAKEWSFTRRRILLLAEKK